MANPAAFDVVAAPPAQPPMAGLLASLGSPGGMWLDPPNAQGAFSVLPLNDGVANPAGRAQPEPRWELGFQYLPEQVCNQGGVGDPCDMSGVRALPSQPNLISAQPFYVWTGDKCSAFGWKAHDFVGRATRALLAYESRGIAHELWTGALAQSRNWPNPYLAGAATDVLTASPVTPANALAILEQGIAACGNGQQGMIHVTPQLGSLLSELGNVFITANGVVRTYRGTVIVADAGYDGSSPMGAPATDGSQFAYATLMPQVRRGPVEILPDTFENALDETNNSVEWYAQRLAAVTFPDCCNVGVQVNVPLPLTGGVS